jgi:ABC-2 type transport system permease protein/oleandomycin transport system permease protein
MSTFASDLSPTPALDDGRLDRVVQLRWLVSDWATVTWRNLLRMSRLPDAVFFSSVQPVMFVLLFRYVFGGAISHLPHLSYVNYLVAGVYVQTVMFGAISTAVGLSEDLQAGLIERFRALPMARSAVLAGRTLADAVRNIGVLVLITGVGYAVGFRAQTSPWMFILGLLLVLVFAYALSWAFAIIGLSTPNSETAQLASFPILFPFTFASTAFVPVTTMPGWLQAFVKHQPVSLVINATRELMLGTATGRRLGLWSPSDVWQALAWAIGLLVVFAPIAVWRFRRAA